MPKTQKQFEGQHDDEKVVLVFRRHPIAMRKGFYLLLVPFVLASIPTLINPAELTFLLIAFGGLGVGLLFFFYHWVGWYYSVFILTDQRVRQVSQSGLFGVTVIDLDVSKIQNISYNVPGLNGELFGFGAIVIQTYVGDLVLDNLHHPDRIYNVLQDVVKQANVNARTQYPGPENETIQEFN